VGNLSYDATESDLVELFNGVGQVRNAEIVTYNDTYRSKGFGFVTMQTVDEALRAVETLHDKHFMGRKLVVNGSRSEGPREPRV
jgi:RNA recognition motif-containing protein